MSNLIRLGAVAYDPKVVTIWEGMREFFASRGVPTDFVLYSNYDSQVNALMDGSIDIAWNTNLAYIKVFRRTKGTCGVLAMRDTDVGFKTTMIAGTATNIDGLSALKGKRLALGSRDSAQAAILPIYFLKRSGIDPDQDLRITRFNVDVGKHGDTGASETQVLDAVSNGSADVGAIGDQYWARVLTEHLPQASRVRSIWTSPGYCHCNFTILSRDDYPRFTAWTEALLAMDYNKPEDRKIMDMEGLTQWIRPQLEGYGVLFEAVDELAFFSDES